MLSLLIPLLLFVVACSPGSGHKSEEHIALADSVKVIKPIDSVLAEHTATWMKIPGVIGTGQTQKDGKAAILILVDTLSPQLKTRLPDTVEGYPVVIEQTGTIRALPKN